MKGELYTDLIAAPVTYEFKQGLEEYGREIDRTTAWMIRKALEEWLARNDVMMGGKQ